MAVVPQQQPPQKRGRWKAFVRSFKESNYITDFWTWLLTLLSKSAELVLFGSILYSSYQLIPGVPAVPAGIDAFLFLVQQAALDIGGMGLLKLAKRAGLPKESFPMRVGITLVILMIANVVLATIKHALPGVPGAVYVTIETLLLIARAIMAVLFGHAIHALREEYGESTVTIKDADELRQQIERLAAELTTLRQSVQAQLASDRASLQERLQGSQEVMALLPGLQARMQQLESSTVREVHAMKAALEQLQRQTRATPPPNVRMLPPRQESAREPEGGKSTARAFVEACLQEDASLKLSQLQKRAQLAGYALSEATVSRYRTQFFHRCESTAVGVSESSTLQGASDDESSDESAAL